MTYFFFKQLKIIVTVNVTDVFTLEFFNTPFATTGGENESEESNFVTSIFGLADIELTQWFSNNKLILRGEHITGSYVVPFSFSSQVTIDECSFNEGNLKTKLHGSLPYGDFDNYDYDIVGQLIIAKTPDITNDLINSSREDFIMNYKEN